ncbi:hypothetical protein RB195_018846 [Necator americanus]
MYSSVMSLDSQDKVFLGATLATAVVGAALVVTGFVLRFGRGFGTFVAYARKDNDFLELRRLDMIFGLFTAAACILILMFFVAAYATIRRNKFLLRAYCAVIAMMVIIQLVSGLLAFTYSDQINQLASDDILYESLNKTASRPSYYSSDLVKTSQDILVSNDLFVVQSFNSSFPTESRDLPIMQK